MEYISFKIYYNTRPSIQNPSFHRGSEEVGELMFETTEDVGR